MKRNIIIISLTLLIVSPAFGWFVFNEGDTAFCVDCESNSSNISTVQSLKDLIVDGASNFLKSYSDILLLLRKIEISGLETLEYSEIQQIVNNAIENMVKSKASYSDLKDESSYIPYNYTVIEKLQMFDYQSYFDSKIGLNPAVYERVEFFLKRGDVRGAYSFMFYQMTDILNRLYIIKKKVDSKLIEIPELWEVNQGFSNAHLFGQYVTQIFHEIK